MRLSLQAIRALEETRKKAKLQSQVVEELGQKAFDHLAELFREGHISVDTTAVQHKAISSHQATLAGTKASARSAKYPTVELYDRLGLQHCLPKEMRARFRESSVHDMTGRRRRQLIRVATPLVKVGHVIPSP